MAAAAREERAGGVATNTKITADTAGATAAAASGIAMGLPDGATATKVQPGQRWKNEGILQKRKDVMEFLDLLSLKPTEQKLMVMATDMYVNRSLAGQGQPTAGGDRDTTRGGGQCRWCGSARRSGLQRKVSSLAYNISSFQNIS